MQVQRIAGFDFDECLIAIQEHAFVFQAFFLQGPGHQPGTSEGQFCRLWLESAFEFRQQLDRQPAEQEQQTAYEG